MRKIPLVPAGIAVLGLTLAVLTGCSASSTSACERPVDDAALSDVVTVTGDFGSQPKVAMYTPLSQKATASEDVIVGDGDIITTDAQVVVLDVTFVSGADGEELVSGSTRPTQLSALTDAFPGLSDGLRCAAQGSRVVVALAPDDITAETAASLGLAEGDSAVAVVDVQQVYLARANGADVFNSGLGLPSVVRATDGRPGVIVPDSAPPSDVVVQTIKRGDGEVVSGEAPVRVNYTSVGWQTKDVVQTTWDAEPPSVSFDADALPFAESLKGQTVGSQVMVIVPGDDQTLVYVIDILGIDPVAAQ
ncbi:MAG: hypothetical protein ABWY03_06665 [Microbacterium sp.]